MRRALAGLAALALAAGAAAQNPQPHFDKAVQELRAKRPAEALAAVNQALTVTEKIGPVAQRVDARTRAAQILWSLNQRPQAEQVLLTAVKEIDAAPNLVGPSTTSDAFRMLGVVYRDLNRPAEAVPWLQRAVAINRSMPESSEKERGDKYFRLSSNLKVLAEQQCHAGLVSSAEATDRERLAACRMTLYPQTTGACLLAPRPCDAFGWMNEDKKQKW